MRTKITRIHDFPAVAAADLGNRILSYELPKNYVYVSLILQAVAVVTTTVVAPTRSEDAQHRMAERYTLTRDGGTPVNVAARPFGLFAEELHGVADDIQETAPLVIGANTLEHLVEIPLCDPTVPFASPQYVESLLVGFRRTALEFKIQVPLNVEQMYTAAGGTVVLTSLNYHLFARILTDYTQKDVQSLLKLNREMRYITKREVLPAATGFEYGVYRDEHLDRDVRPLKIGHLLMDDKVRDPDLLEECTVKIGGDFYQPENFDADCLKAIDVWRGKFDQVDGFYITDLDGVHDHASAPFASRGADFQLWRTILAAGPVAAGSYDVVQMSIGDAEYKDKKV